MEEDLPNVLGRMANGLDVLAGDFSLIQQLIQKDRECIEAGTFVFRCGEPRFHQVSYWFYLLDEFYINREQARQIAEATASENNGFHLALNGIELSIIQGQIKLVPQEEQPWVDAEILIRQGKNEQINLGKQTLQVSFREGNTLPANHAVLVFDADRLVFPLSLNHPKQGDRFRPLGMSGSKLLSDFYNDLKIPASEKSIQWVVRDGDQRIVAVLPYRISEEVKVLDKTSSLLLLELKP